ncbi:MAG: tetratricopeptide repeat protein [Gemmatimonadaceae bacterium]|nr:tetratricopeptide repeat protein [Gemmatimonadaceae bacterium]
MADDIRALSEALAVDPSSVAFVALAEALRKRGDLDVAARVAAKGVERHPSLVDGHDVRARIALDRQALDEAAASWESVLRLVPDHRDAQKGLGFICFQQGRFAEAAAYLAAVAEQDPDDASVAAALDTVRAAAMAGPRSSAAVTAPVADERERSTTMIPAVEEPAPITASGVAPFARRATWSRADAAILFDDLLTDVPGAAMHLDEAGLVLAGRYLTEDGRDLAAEVGAQLSGVSDEATRAMRHFGFGAWTQIVFETEVASVAMAPVGQGLTLVAAARTVPLGFLRRLLDRAADRIRAWVGE